MRDLNINPKVVLLGIAGAYVVLSSALGNYVTSNLPQSIQSVEQLSYKEADGIICSVNKASGQELSGNYVLLGDEFVVDYAFDVNGVTYTGNCVAYMSESGVMSVHILYDPANPNVNQGFIQYR